MKRAVLTRTATGDEGTFGEIVADDFKCVCLELPWRDNAKGKSCIPAGVYVFRWRTDSPKHGECYEALPDTDAPGRTNVQIHSANLAGDEEKGYVKQLEGCLAPGEVLMNFQAGVAPAGAKDQRGVAGSRSATNRLAQAFGREPFEMEIKWADYVGPKGA